MQDVQAAGPEFGQIGIGKHLRHTFRNFMSAADQIFARSFENLVDFLAQPLLGPTGVTEDPRMLGGDDQHGIGNHEYF